MTRDVINQMLDESRQSLVKAHQLQSVRDALRSLNIAQQWLNDSHTIVKDSYNPVIDKKPIETFTTDELLAEVRRRMTPDGWAPATG